MIDNYAVITKMQADSLLGVRLDKALAGVKDAVLDQARHVNMGVTRLAFYSSYFTDNYQDVCAAQKSEDVRFMEALVHLVKRHDVIKRMFQIYVENLLSNRSSESTRRIQQALIKKGATIASSSLTNQGLSSAIVAALGFSFGMKISVDTKLAKISAVSVTLASYYGYVQEAAEAAHRLLQLSPIYYSALYAEKLEMLYFIIEPVINQNVHLISTLSSEDEIANAIMRVLR